MGSVTSGSLQPTYKGLVASTKDALVLFEACLQGHLTHVPRRPHDRERSHLIKSGSVFVYEENASGIKRWTDGVPWSPSRILGNFLVYRELLKPFPPGEKKRATKRNKRPPKTGELYPSQGSDSSVNGSAVFSPTTPTTPGGRSDDGFDKEAERALIGSLVDSYGFKSEGLVKKTMSVNVNGIHHHLVSYYTLEDVKHGVLITPQNDPEMRHIHPRPELTLRQHFRAPLDDIADEGLQDSMSMGVQPSYGYDSGYGSRLSMSQPSNGHQSTIPSGYNTQYGAVPAYPHAPQTHHSLQTYSAMPSSAGFSGPSLPAPQVVAPKQEDYPTYQSYQRYASLATSAGPVSERPPSHTQRLSHRHSQQPAPQGYSYQNPQASHTVSRFIEPSSHHTPDHRASDPSAWRMNNVYAPTASTSSSTADNVSAYSHGQNWNVAAIQQPQQPQQSQHHHHHQQNQQQQQLPRPGNMVYTQGYEPWGVQPPIAPRQNGYHGAAT
ncbi:hypothetical protein MMC06_004599 [Schaereria dolodes]|nr:hypothetical protein [Schaereria dolodes]